MSSLIGFTISSNGQKLFSSFNFKKINKIKYDDIVDRSQFRPDSEQTRNFALTGAGSSSQGVYDNDNIPDDDIVRVRTGKLDRTEVANLVKQKTEQFHNVNSEIISDTKEKERQAILDARQEYLDKATGFSGSPKTV